VVAVISKPVQQIGITELAAGIYTLTITHAEGIETIRFVKK
ncbi:MAG: T9SS type A sorting domain-containing protein, partial [Crocinitomicaceae bacterium]|nr:T9SS type A sorting domain-containing protein [Crocinitomicaceae bacterium]